MRKDSVRQMVSQLLQITRMANFKRMQAQIRVPCLDSRLRFKSRGEIREKSLRPISQGSVAYLCGVHFRHNE